MPDTKISDLPLASTFDGSEYWVSSQSGTTVKMTTQSVYNSISKTYAEVAAMILTETLITGAWYFISDKNIYVKALSTSLLSSNVSREMRIVKDTYYQPSGVNKGVWSSGLSVSINDVVVWGGKVWINQTGLIGTIIDDNDLDATNWTVEPNTNDTYYFDKVFFSVYDFDNDLITTQIDDRGNYIYQNITGFIERTDWGNSLIKNNICTGIFNNSNYSNEIFGNIIPAPIQQNSNDGDIMYNTNNGGVSLNSNIGRIKYNNNNGDIISNSNDGTIELNKNNGNITSNANLGNIKLNNNNGIISGIGAANTSINNNINNGDISTTTTGSITDTIVNK